MATKTTKTKPAAKVQDRPVVQASLANLIQEVEAPEEYRIALPDSKIITFPDLYARESEDAERTFASIDKNSTNWRVLRKWLSPEDAEALKAQGLTLAQLTHVVKTASNYYEDFYGAPGESDASES
jgi:hypothetical protein